MAKRTDSTTEGEIRLGWRMAGIGMEVATLAAGGALLGWLYDRWRGSGQTGILVGASVGIIVGLYSLIKESLKLNRQLDRQYPTKGRGEAIPEPDSEDQPDPWDDWDGDGEPDE